VQNTQKTTGGSGHSDDMPAGIFRAYDIRGLAGTELTPDNIERIGRAIGNIAQARGRSELLFGADARLSSPGLAAALKAGILASGCHITDLGTIPTPLLYFAAHTTDCDSGVMLTASHNPGDYNGIKIVLENTCLPPEDIQAIRERALTLDAAQKSQKPGTLRKLDITKPYMDHVCSNIRLKRPLRLVVDCGNAVPGLVAPALMRALGCEVKALFCEPDGHFPNHHPDPTIAENLRALRLQVHLEQADLGIALDGDGDRVVMVSNSGAVIDTDRLLMLFVRDIVPRSTNKNVVFDVKCSKLLANVIEQNGGVPIMCRSGHSFMKQRMMETGAPVGAEFSAHVFIRDRWFGFDDGMYVAARFMELLAARQHTVDDMLATLPESISTPELRIAVPEDRKFEIMAQVASLADFPEAEVCQLDGIRADFDHGWGLIRASNTTPALLLRFEADTQVALTRIQQAFRDLLSRVDGELEIQF